MARKKHPKSTLWREGGAGFASNKDDWATPQGVFDALDAEFGFELDVCASETNAKCPRFFTAKDDGLSKDWHGVCWMNAPYGRHGGGIDAWMKKAHGSAEAAATVVCLIPARTFTRWWHDYAMRASEVRLVKDRLKFGNGQASAPFPSAIVIFRPGHTGPPCFSAVCAPRSCRPEPADCAGCLDREAATLTRAARHWAEPDER